MRGSSTHCQADLRQSLTSMSCAGMLLLPSSLDCHGLQDGSPRLAMGHGCPPTLIGPAADVLLKVFPSMLLCLFF